MTHPTRAPRSKTNVADAMRAISDSEMVEMCLAVNMQMGTPAANKLLDLFDAARRAKREAAE
jgi:hypothetical protein